MKKKNNRINRTLLIGMVVLSATIVSLLASCKKEDKPNTHANLNLDGISFTATTEGHDRNAKTYLDGEDIKWMAGDLILVQNSASPVQQAPFEVVDGLQTMNGTFYTGSTFDRSPAYDAAYPYSMATLSGTTATFTLPQQQQMTVTGTFGNGAMPMVAHSTNNVLNFYNVCGGVCFPLQGAGKHVTKIVLTSKNTADKLWGTFTASTTAVPESGNVTSGPMPTHVSDGSNSVELICNGSTGITLEAEPQDFYIMVPPQTMTTGFTVTAYDGTNVIYNQDINWDASTHANFIKRSVVSKVQTAITIADPLSVTTVSPTFISTTQAYGQGTVTSAAANNVTERGVCWALGSVTTMPTLANSYKAEGGTTTGNYGTMFGDSNPMTKDQVYYVRAYAKNAVGEVYYGDPIPFATRKDYANDYNGCIPYAFSVAVNRQVNFSSGNLQYLGTGYTATNHFLNTTTTYSDNTWRFAEYQFEWVGGNAYGSSYGNVYANGEYPTASQNGTKSDNNNITNGASNTQWIDLFGWGTSGYHNSNDPYNINYRPYDIRYDNASTSTFDWTDGTHYSLPIEQNPFGYGPSMGLTNVNWNLVGTSANYDWGVYNNICNDGSFGAGAWRTMTCDSDLQHDGEWNYLFEQRRASTINGTANARFATAQLNVRLNQLVNGVMLFPDNYTWPAEVSYYPGSINDGYAVFGSDHQWTEAEWSLLEKNGAVFLPAAGYRQDPDHLVTVPSLACFYWSVTRGDIYFGNHMYINYSTNSNHLTLGSGIYSFEHSIHYQGQSVRLVRNVN